MASNEELIRKGFKAFDDGDLATLDQLVADDVVWVSEGNNVLSGRYEGKQALFELWATIPGLVDGKFQQDAVEVFTDDRVAVAVTEVTADRKGKHLEKARGVIVFVIKDGRVTEGRVIAADPAQDDEFWAK